MKYLNNIMYKKENINKTNLYINLFLIILLFTIIYTVFFSIYYINQLPLEHHPHRQTQTALTAFWFLIDGISINYQTPVLGYPWEIPMEFPIYQAIVSLLAKFSNLSLDSSGRLISYIFLIATLFPIYKITKSLDLDNKVFIVFVPIYISQPLYFFWGRSFMIETAALFFAITALHYYIDILKNQINLRKVLFFTIFILIALLQKVTTAIPIVFGMIILLFSFTKSQSKIPRKKILTLALLIVISIITCFVWIKYTDAIKESRNMGGALTSESLSLWNWGTWSQRFSYELWVKVIAGRIFLKNMGGFIGIYCIVIFFISRLPELRIKKIGYALIFLFFTPLFLFTNLHIVHDYYQVSNLIFITYLFAIIFVYYVLQKYSYKTTLCIFVLLVIINLLVGLKDVSRIRKDFNYDNVDFLVGSILKSQLNPEQQFVAFGNDWSSSYTYISERKSLTAPTWLSIYKEVIRAPENYIEKGKLGAIVSCNDSVEINDILQWKIGNHDPKISLAGGCFFVTKEMPIPKEQIYNSRKCDIEFNKVNYIEYNDSKLIEFNGASYDNRAGIYIKLSDTTNFSNTYYLEAMNYPVSRDKFGFSRVIDPSSFEKGYYRLSLFEMIDNNLYQCDNVKESFLNIK